MTTSPAIQRSQKPASDGSEVVLLTRQLDVLVFDANKVAILAKLRRVEVANWNAKACETNKLLAIETSGVRKNTTTIDDGDGLL